MNENMIRFAKCSWLVAAWIAAAIAAQETPAQESAAWRRIQAYFEPPPNLRDDYGDFRQWLHDAHGEPLGAEQWPALRAEIRDDWITAMGQFPPPIRHPRVAYEGLEIRDAGVRQYRVRFALAPGHVGHAYLLIPKDAALGATPAVVTVFYEPETAIGRGKPQRDFAIQLARRGFVTLSVGHDYSLYFPDREHCSVQPLAALAGAARNAYYVLAGRPEVDPQRVGVLGHSYGGKWAMFAAALHDEFACGAWSDPGVVFDDAAPSINYWEPWYLGYDGPEFRTRGLPTETNPARGLYAKLRREGRDLHELHLLMAPRPFFVSGGSEDPPERWKALNHSRLLNRILGAKHRVGMSNRPQHSPTAESNAVLYDFFTHFLEAEAPR